MLAEARGLPERGLVALARTRTRGWGLANAQSTRVRLLLATDDLDAVATALPTVADAAEAQAGLAHLRLASDNPYGALEALDGARADCAHVTIELLLLETLARSALDRPDVRPVFESALAAAETSGHRTVLLQTGERLRPLLVDAVRHGTAHRALVGELLDMLDDREPRTVVGQVIDELSSREASVLRLLDTTLSNREIADQLQVSTNTVKTHLRAIYRKLDVTDRRAAVQRARAMGLLKRAGLSAPATAPGRGTHAMPRG
jgi:LuxR family maltose regulon positive regulatory protein